MKKAILTLLIAGTASAHPVDKERERLPHLGFDNQEFFDCSNDYWHCRRELFAHIERVRECIGETRAYGSILNKPEVRLPIEFEEYSQRVPAHPVEDKPGDVFNCRAHIAACEASFRPEFEEVCNYVRNLYALEVSNTIATLKLPKVIERIVEVPGKCRTRRGR